MIKFFRKIRQTLIMKNQTGKYLKYAIGEIILVVIGILIALQINNWNEGRKTNEKMLQILNTVKQDLVSDIGLCNNIIKNYKSKDSIRKLIFEKKLDNVDFSKIKGQYLTSDSFVLEINTNGYSRYAENIDKIPKSYDSLTKILNSIYKENKSNLDLYNSLMDDGITQQMNSLAKSKTWFSDWERGIASPEANLYFMTDSIALNRTTMYLSILEALANESLRLKRRSITAIKAIEAITNNKYHLPEYTSLNLSNSIIANELTGVYKLKENNDLSKSFNDSEMIITKKNDALFISTNTRPELPLYWNHGLTFFSNIGFVSFKKIDNDIQLHIQRRAGDILLIKTS